MVGHTLGHYRITAKIGSGGMGDVYRASDTTLHRDVALKVISPEFANDPERMARFEREAQVLASLTHGSIAAIYGVEQSGKDRALVMELVHGEDLSDKLRRGAMPLDDAIRTGAYIAEALEAAHEHGVIHRDLKPANVKILESGHVKLLDFGLAKALEDSGPPHLTQAESATLSVAATRAGIILGTAAYMSPEQATGSPADKRSDVWSFGVVLFEMLCGTRLFDGQTTSHVLAEVIRAEIDFERLPASVPAEVRTLIERCLERDPRRRLRDIREARLVLERVAHRGTGSHTALRSGPVAVRPSSTGWRSRVPWLAAGALIAGLAAAAVAWMAWPAVPLTPQLRVETALPGAALFNPVGSAIELSADGQSIAMVVEGRAEGSAKLLLRRLNELTGTTLIDDTSGALLPYNPFFSPDGAWVGYAVSGELRRVPVAGGTPLTITKVMRSRGAVWTADGTIIFAASPGSGLSRVPVAGGEPQPVTTLDAEKKEAAHRWPHLLRGGKTGVFRSLTSATEGFDRASIEAVRLDTGERTRILAGGAYGRYSPSGHLVYLANNTIFAIPFDPGRLTVSGQPVPVVQDVTSFVGEGSANFTFGANGLMAYMRGRPSMPKHGLAWVDRTGRVTPIALEPGTYGNPRLSPDGKRLAMTVFRDRNWDIWVYDLERQVFTRVTFDEGVETEQVWSPDSHELAYSLDIQGNRSIVNRKAADGSGAVTAILEGNDYLWPSSWSPDGRLITVTSSQLDIGVITVAEPKQPTWIVKSGFPESDSAISPDGRYLAYTSRESGRPEVYVRQFPSGSGRWQISTDGGSYARWTRGGAELVYRTTGGMMAVSTDMSDGSFRSGTPRELFKGMFTGGLEGVAVEQYTFADYDVSADGARFLMFPRLMESIADSQRHVTLVTNWFDQLRRATSK
jgi:Tol biopolymer transport system component